MSRDDGVKLHYSTLLPLVYISQDDFNKRRKVHESIFCLQA